MAPMLGQIQREWQNPDCRHWHERLAENRPVVRYDYKNSELSERKVTQVSIDAWLLDVDAMWPCPRKRVHVGCLC